MSKSVPTFVGIDVSKDKLDVAVRPVQEQFSASNDDTGIAELRKRLKRHRGALVVIEATGGLEHVVAAALSTSGFCVAIVNPRQVREFGRAIGQLAKTDKIDADLWPCSGRRSALIRDRFLTRIFKRFKHLSPGAGRFKRCSRLKETGWVQLESRLSVRV